jgi:hypothetical protein
MHACESPIERRFVEAVPFDDFGIRTDGNKASRIPGETPDPPATLFETSKEMTADVSGRAGQENVACHHLNVAQFMLPTSKITFGVKVV